MLQTARVMPEMSVPSDPDEASFTLPARPGVLLPERDRVDLLAHEATRRILPEGTRSGGAVLGGLVLLSALVGGVTGALVVIGVSTLLAASAALVTGHLSLAQAGGQRGANLLLGVGAGALILGSVVSQQTRPATELVAGTSVAVSSPNAVTTPSPYAVSTPAPSAQSEPSVAVASPTDSADSADSVDGAGLTLSPDAFLPHPAEADVVPATHPGKPAGSDEGNGPSKAKGNGNDKGGANGAQASKDAGGASSTARSDEVANIRAIAAGTVRKSKPQHPVRRGFATVRFAGADLP